MLRRCSSHLLGCARVLRRARVFCGTGILRRARILGGAGVCSLRRTRIGHLGRGGFCGTGILRRAGVLGGAGIGRVRERNGESKSGAAESKLQDFRIHGRLLGWLSITQSSGTSAISLQHRDFFAAQGFPAAQGLRAAHGLPTFPLAGVKLFWSSVEYAASAASSFESQGSGCAAMGASMQI